MQDNIRQEIRDLAARGNVTHEEYSLLRMNSWEREYLFPELTSDALVKLTEYYIKHCGGLSRGLHRPASTYDEAVIHRLVPLLISRLVIAEHKLVQNQPLPEFEYDKLEYRIVGPGDWCLLNGLWQEWMSLHEYSSYPMICTRKVES